jgi:ubiquinone biosynthesis monooxygenase Coq7
MPVSHQTPNPNACVSVMYDGSCPLCLREIQIYQRLQPQQALQWVDVSTEGAALPPGTTQTQLMQRFHVVTAQGELLDGARAFVHLWQQLPGWRHLARVCRLPGVLTLMEWTYRLFLRWRPAIQRWVKRRESSQNQGVS